MSQCSSTQPPTHVVSAPLTPAPPCQACHLAPLPPSSSPRHLCIAGLSSSNADLPATADDKTATATGLPTMSPQPKTGQSTCALFEQMFHALGGPFKIRERYYHVAIPAFSHDLRALHAFGQRPRSTYSLCRHPATICALSMHSVTIYGFQALAMIYALHAFAQDLRSCYTSSCDRL